MQVIPAIDLLNGDVVRLKKGDYNQVTTYSNNLLDFAKQYQKAGFDHIHIVDLNGAKEGQFVNLPHIKNVIEKLNLSVQTGGGIRKFEDVQYLLDAGLSQVICTSMAVKNEAAWLKALTHFGADKCVLGMDLKDGKIAFSGWLETIEEDTYTYLERQIEAGLTRVLCTDISRDGMLSGPNVELYKEIKTKFPQLHITASGGVSKLDDLKVLKDENIDAVVVGRAFYEGHITLDEMKSVHL